MLVADAIALTTPHARLVAHVMLVADALARAAMAARPVMPLAAPCTDDC